MHLPIPGLFSVVLLFAAGICLLLSIHAFRRYISKEALFFACLALAITFYAGGYAFELLNSTISGMLLWVRIEYIGVAVLPALWLLFSVQYSGNGKWLSPQVISAFFFIPVLTFVLNYTNEFHHLYYSAVRLNTEAPFPVLAVDKGPWYWVQQGYTMLSILSGNVLFLRRVWLISPAYRRQAAIVLSASFIPWVSNFIYALGLTPWGIDVTPFTLAVSGSLFAVGLFKYHLFDLIPIARERVFEHISDAVIVVDRKGRILDFNPAGQRFCPALNEESFGKPVREVLKGIPGMMGVLDSDAREYRELCVRHEERDRYYHIQNTPITDSKRRVLGNALILHEETEEVLLREQLKKLSTTDGLTNVFNRRYFLELGTRELLRAKRYGLITSFLMIDMDYFKRVNDTFGHSAGDTVLKAVARICVESLRSTDLFCRYGGEEFAVLLPETTAETAFSIAQRLCDLIAMEQIDTDSGVVNITASIGVTDSATEPGLDLSEYLNIADRAMYRAKEMGRNRAVLATH